MTTTLTREQPSAWERARRRVDPDSPLVSWAASLGVTALALALRLWHLGTPKKFEFDETYYAKDAWSLAHYGYVRQYVDGANDKILDGTTTGIWKDDPSLIVHPEVGKWLIALGEKAFGMDPFGWRISAVVAGTLMVLVMCRLAKRLTGSTLLGCTAGLLLTVDGLHFVLSRLALLDIFLALFMLLAVTCLVADRDWYRDKLARLQTEPVTDAASWGPVRGLLFRPWLLWSGLFWGLAVGTKWTALFPMAAFGVMVWIWSAGARRSFGVRSSLLRSAVADGAPAFVSIVLLAGIVYTATWTGWLMHAHEYEDSYSSTQYTRYSGEGECDGKSLKDPSPTDDRWPTAMQRDRSGPGELWQSLRSLANYHQDLLTFHSHFLSCSEHSYASKPSGLAAHQQTRERGRRAGRATRRAGLRRPGRQHLPAPGAAHRHPGDLVGRHRRGAVRGRDVGRSPGLAVRRRRGRRRVDLAAVAAVRRPADLLLLRDRDAAVHDPRPHAADGEADRLLPAARPAPDDGHRPVRRLRGDRAAELRVVLAGAHLRPAGTRRVAGPDLVQQMGVR